MKNKTLKILAISGSLRATSSNTTIIRAIGNMLPANVEYVIYDGLATLPHFNDIDGSPQTVEDWRKQIAGADAVLFCTPEYAFGVPGTLKNALDWTVASGDLTGKPVALITAATSGEKAHTALLNIFTALSVNIPEGAALLIQFVRSKIDGNGNITDVKTLKAVQNLIASLLASV
ncbi:MAG TPA: NADPH-dependent FMN reductase [Panacibacter sp.]|nr:NADPH-dependent FMN reductase [Panacibacter sp.]